MITTALTLGAWICEPGEVNIPSPGVPCEPVWKQAYSTTTAVISCCSCPSCFGRLEQHHELLQQKERRQGANRLLEQRKVLAPDAVGWNIRDKTAAQQQWKK